MVQSRYVDDTFHPVRAGVVQKVLENPNHMAELSTTDGRSYYVTQKDYERLLKLLPTLH